MQTITIHTEHKTQVIRVTDQLAEMVADIADGLAFFNVPHTTAALIMCEDDDELRDDLVKVAQNILAEMRPFRHIRKNNPNAEAHILARWRARRWSLQWKMARLSWVRIRISFCWNWMAQRRGKSAAKLSKRARWLSETASIHIRSTV